MKIINIDFRLEIEYKDDDGFYATTSKNLGSKYEWSLPESWRILSKEQKVKLIVDQMKLEALRLQNLLHKEEVKDQEEIKEEAEEDDKEH